MENIDAVTEHHMSQEQVEPDRAVFCPECRTTRDRQIERREETYTINGTPITVDAEVAVCSVCGTDIVDPELDDATLSRAYDEYRRMKGLIRPEQIQQLRERYQLSQRAFARLLGWGEVTVHRYESGALPDSAHNELLVALQDDDTMRRFIQRHRDRLSAAEWRRASEAMSQGSSRAGGARQIWQGIHALMNGRAPADRGNRIFDLDRFGQMVVFFASDGAPARTKLLKLLFYADFLAYKRLSVSLSGTPYVHYPLGPVPEQYELLLSELEREGVIDSIRREYVTPQGVREGTEYRARLPFDPSLFTPDEVEILERVHADLERLGAQQIKDRSHRERAWLATGDRELIPYALAENLSLD